MVVWAGDISHIFRALSRLAACFFFLLLSSNDHCSIFRWSNEDATIEGIDEATIGLLDEHRLTFEELENRYCTSLDLERPEHSNGMNPERAAQVLDMVGCNELTPAPSEPAWKLFLRELRAPLNVMLICAALLCIFVSELKEQSSLYKGRQETTVSGAGWD